VTQESRQACTFTDNDMVYHRSYCSLMECVNSTSVRSVSTYTNTE